MPVALVCGCNAAKELRLWSGVTVLLMLVFRVAGLSVAVELLCGAGGGGVDHENVAAGFDVPDCVLEPEGREVAAAVAGAEDHASNPPSSALLELALFLPKTKFSKSSTPPLPFASSSLIPFAPLVGARLDIKSALFALAEFVAESSCNFLVCSVSIREESALINFMKAWNC